MYLLKLLIIYLALMPAVIMALMKKNCDKFGVLLYEDLNCKANYDEDNRISCPISYDCKGLYKSTRKCHFKGKPYKLDEKVDSELTAAGCDLSCFCQKQRNE